MAVPRPGDLRPAPALAIAGTLAAVAGFVDVVGFSRILGVFPANQSGNVVLFGMALGGTSPTPGWRTGTAIVSFAAGSALGFAAGRRLAPARKGPLLVAGEIALLVVVLAIAGPYEGTTPAAGLEGAVSIVVASLAMGVQTEAIRRVAGVAVATTYQSGAVARIGEVAAGALGATPGPRRFVSELRILSLVLFTYVGGAAAGATAVGEWRWALTVPVALLVALAAVWRFGNCARLGA